ncbi:MAG: RNA polymerase sigma factor [Crocinitomix sp.]|nr:RNA polymerase sigma factor [Crocinitomix sp.]
MKNQQEIFLKLIQENRGILLKVSRIYMNNPQDREDLEQEIVFQLWRSFAYFKGESKFSTWMYRVALNTAITYFKQEKRRPDHGTFRPEMGNLSETEEVDKESQLAHFYRAVQELSKIEKALILQFIEGLSHAEISENLGLSEVNTRVKLNRTKKKIQELIKAQGYEF